jgi:hypothetical protein
VHVTNRALEAALTSPNTEPAAFDEPSCGHRLEMSELACF